MNVQQKSKGFTIIEVVLVLAIAGLIFLIVFLALPALQKSQRDTQRRSDIGRAISAIQTWQSNKNGKIPTAADMTTVANFRDPYLRSGGASFADPSGGDYTFVAMAATVVVPSGDTTATNDTDGKLKFKIGYTCDGTAKSNAMSIVANLESGGFYCTNN